MTRDAKTLGEELLGAEIVVGKELTEAAGGFFEGLERIHAIWQQQTAWLVDDYLTFWGATLARPGRPEPLLALVRSRSEHIAAGVDELGATLERESAPLRKMWMDFASVVRSDWRR